MPSANYYAPSLLVTGAKSEPYLLLTSASLPPGTMGLFPGTIIVSSSDATWTPTTLVEGVGELSTPRPTYWHMQPDIQEALLEQLFTPHMALV